MQGYGVSLAIRNIEYKVFDDRSDGADGGDGAHSSGLLVNATAVLAEQQQQAAGAAMANQFLAGVNLTALHLFPPVQDNNERTEDPTTSQQQQLQAELWKIHDRQQLHAQIVPPVWQRRQLPLQAATVIAAATDPLVTLETVAQNLPSVASTLVHVQVSESVRQAAVAVEQHGNSRSAALRPGLLYLNGRVAANLERPSFNVFELLNELRQEQRTLRKLQEKLGPALLRSHHSDKVTMAVLRDVQAAWIRGPQFWSGSSSSVDERDDDDDDDAMDDGASSSDSVFRIDVGRGWKQAIIYLNDIEKDAQYAQWSRSLRQMMMNMQFGMPPTVRRNLFTILAVVDPVQASAENAGFMLGMQLMQSSYPARVGALVVGQDDVQACARWLASQQQDDVDDDTICPTKPIFADAEQRPSGLADLKGIPATTQAVHRLIARFARDYGSHPQALVAYVEYLLDSMGDVVDMHDLISTHVNLIEGMQLGVGAEAQKNALQALLDDDDDEETQYLYGKALRFAVDKGLKPGTSFLNGRPLPADDNESDLAKIFGEEQSHIFKMIVSGEITDTSPKSVYAKLLTGDRVYKRNHPLLAQEGVTHQEIKHQFPAESLLLSRDDTWSPSADAYFLVEAFLDYESVEGLQLAQQFLSVLSTFPLSIKSSDEDATTIGLVYRILPSTRSSAESAICPLLANARVMGVSKLKDLLGSVSLPLDGATVETLLKDVDVSSEVRQQIISSIGEGNPCWGPPSFLSDNRLPAQNVVVANGRVYEIDDGASIAEEDIDLLLSIELKRSKAVTSVLRKSIDFSDPGDATVVSDIATFLATQEGEGKSGRMQLIENFEKLEATAELASNPLRFSWNTEPVDNEDALQVRLEFTVSCFVVAAFTLVFAKLILNFFSFRFSNEG